MRRLTHSLLAAALLAALASDATAASFRVPGGTIVNLPITSWSEQRFRGIVRQNHDLSCGAAALATLLQHFYGEDTGEFELIEQMIKAGDEEKIAKLGFSMLELKSASEFLGYKASGFRITNVQDLRKLKVPALTLIKPRGYAHFVVLKRVEGDRVFIADPAFGNSAPTLDQFEQIWDGVILVLLSNRNKGDEAFFQDLTIKARMGEIIQIIDRVLTNIRPGAGEF